MNFNALAAYGIRQTPFKTRVTFIKLLIVLYIYVYTATPYEKMDQTFGHVVA